MIFSRVGPGDQNGIGFFDAADGIGHCSASERGGQTGHRRAVSETGAVIDIIGLQYSPAEFIGQVVFLIADPGRREHPDTVSAVLLLDFTELFRNQVQGFVPGCLTEVSVLFYQRCGQSIRRADKIIAEAPFHAQAAEIRC